MHIRFAIDFDGTVVTLDDAADISARPACESSPPDRRAPARGMHRLLRAPRASAVRRMKQPRKRELAMGAADLIGSRLTIAHLDGQPDQSGKDALQRAI